MVFGNDADRGLRLRGMQLEVVRLGDGTTESELMVHDAHDADPTLAFMLSRLRHPQFPEPCGVLRAVSEPVFEGALDRQSLSVAEPDHDTDLLQLFESGDTWDVN